MSNETKRDVFDDLLEDLADAHIALDGEGIGKELTNEDKQAYLKDYDNALPDDLPVIPMKIGNFMKQSVYEDATLQEALECAHDKQFGVGRWISAHSEIFALAWLLGVWRVEETGEVVKL
ncbi:hypothetical protein LacP0734_00045 [Lacticaseibacillus paracasei subsp. tolerans]|uniref:hypothetical protein n=1 Tax=Lacticaseibacillus paracasei TaxID=1597 RepID=UPI001892CE0A|nr:hypothetical protein [Lacticaseibacillus paracasei]QPC18897.1 hypothetical protein LacP0734_00045 [Lacticaseibacillus paracasei subsp. tolerans]